MPSALLSNSRAQCLTWNNPTYRPNCLLRWCRRWCREWHGEHHTSCSTEGGAVNERRRKISKEDSRRDEQERAKNHEFWAWKARNLSAWAPRGMG